MASDTYAQRLDLHCKTSEISTSKRTQVLELMLLDYTSFMNHAQNLPDVRVNVFDN